jgi:hypothetical protein
MPAKKPGSGILIIATIVLEYKEYILQPAENLIKSFRYPIQYLTGYLLPRELFFYYRPSMF